jgi:hypothetical protein
MVGRTAAVNEMLVAGVEDGAGDDDSEELANPMAMGFRRVEPE